ncbi:MAG: succinate dehydrogenase, cytochrome b556 subunit [Phenylobacterium sp.]|uniref:succinate dehydrogenase, cytochrome b556 subunit n=1 Tax=Phenylobacterium sp. TaxID=1871053 RepID=UPI00272747FD|nr:succinate dehydrogenase, cytochrome b556 subunit [Phenylobacterium sp.]MDO8911249.1 succinate dehydrogenase, cytochrome b556 subunit [Phenylobacterium sp.]MDP2010969.1 succinate dehydrogenase, cytochrome b556 subunit [Phenylobacterium sp.]MDP3099184.1 succinate dehydrogenase, cytochrome b556 subunit [Phenylobacterium sp.]MDP3632921.1 succinate dehydrogenase, cytochrome b556 subunit [Phenylobacterium sp.]MDP3870359.1 succinate dehydrogenase, cytochrome b556 subunit [Phenylobacterium sp.]
MTETTPGPRARPLSPHLEIWRFHATMVGSILHRITGVGLYFGALILAGWALSLAAGPDAYQAFMELLGSPLGKLVMFGLTLSVFYHLAKGVQHLLWDAGTGFQLPIANMGAIACYAFAIAASLAVWAIAWMTGAL